jgi:hypothetical protein
MFSRRWLINYLLVILIVIFTYVGNRFDVKTGYQKQQSVSGVEAASIDSVEIRTADVSIVLQRSAGGWSIESPIRWPANNVNVERLLDIVNSRTDSRIDADAIDLSTLGLDFPRAMLRLNDTRVLFGATNNIGERRYTMIGPMVYLLPDNHLPFVSQGLLGVVDRRLLPRGFELSAIALPGIDISRGAAGGWQAGGAAGIGKQQIEQLIGNWQGLEANRIKRFDSAGTPRQKILARLEGGVEKEFFLMSIDPEIVIANPGIGLQYHFRADLYYQLISLRADENPA